MARQKTIEEIDQAILRIKSTLKFMHGLKDTGKASIAGAVSALEWANGIDSDLARKFAEVVEETGTAMEGD